MTNDRDCAAPEQRLYASWLDAGIKLGFAVLAASFLLYVLEAIPPGIALEALPHYWHLPVGEFVRATGAPTGWSWLARLGEGDVLNFAGVAILALVTAACYARVLPHFARARDRAFVAICVAEIVVLLVAAAGLGGAGH